ncbi:CcdC family protein [Radiobacillus sp. PE A8.2]|uniref:CcdC family protein n=1 Tax=Radiobacillus sp. PE A8.2 TaxID=3380349 RepID=UPI00388D6C97
MFWAIISTIFAAFMAVTMLFVRLRASKRPASVAKIILPPLFMSTGAFMFLFPIFQIHWKQGLEALLVGAIFSLLLIKTSNFVIKGNDIYLVPSKAFIYILLSLLVVRICIKLVVSQSVPLGETGGMFFLLAFGMILPWRIAMLVKYKNLEKVTKTQSAV